MPRYVPKTYNNRRVLRIIVGTAITIALSVVILFLMLFFIFQGYVIDGQLEIPWLTEDNSTPPPPPPSPEESPDETPDVSSEVTVVDFPDEPAE